jgi:PIN domain nuclease of toxin-antitoxin system
VRLLLDTHVYLWFLANDPALSSRARERIAMADEVFVSAASIWECVIKIALRKLDVQPDDLVAGIAGSGFQELPVLARHAARVAELGPYHRDPFDRLLVAQALAEPMQLLTADTALRRYGDAIVIA